MNTTTTNTKERPILFGGEMVRAILDGRKTQTRRVMKDWYYYACLTGDCPHGKQSECDATVASYCKYGQPGDRLWVRETWCQKINDDARFVYNSEGNLDPSCCHYAADGLDVRAVDGDGFQKWNKDGSESSPWVPSIHMPRWASRLTLEIVSVRVERLQEISAEDCIAEGIDYGSHKCGCEVCAMSSRICQASSGTLIEAYRDFWTSINAKTHRWESNPYVWVISFRKM